MHILIECVSQKGIRMVLSIAFIGHIPTCQANSTCKCGNGANRHSNSCLLVLVSGSLSHFSEQNVEILQTAISNTFD